MKHYIFYIPDPKSSSFVGPANSVLYDRTIEGDDWWAPQYADQRIQKLKSRGAIAAWRQPTWHKGAFS